MITNIEQKSCINNNQRFKKTILSSCLIKTQLYTIKPTKKSLMLVTKLKNVNTINCFFFAVCFLAIKTHF